MSVKRINITIPEKTVEKIKKITTKRGMSAFLAKAAEEKVRRLEKEAALKEILEALPTFTEIKDSTRWVRKMRRLDEKRSKHLGL